MDFGVVYYAMPAFTFAFGGGSGEFGIDGEVVLGVVGMVESSGGCSSTYGKTRT